MDISPGFGLAPIHLEPGDALAVTVPGSVDEDFVDVVRGRLRDALEMPSLKVVVLADDIRMRPVPAGDTPEWELQLIMQQQHLNELEAP